MCYSESIPLSFPLCVGCEVCLYMLVSERCVCVCLGSAACESVLKGLFLCWVLMVVCVRVVSDGCVLMASLRVVCPCCVCLGSLPVCVGCEGCVCWL